MPPSTLPFKDTLLYKKRGPSITPSLSTAASTASPVTYPKDDNAMLTRKQREPLYPPPGPRPTRSGLRPPTKTQVQADRKAEKAQKSKAKEDEKLAAIACKLKLKEEKQEKLILLAEERAKKATARADAARLSLDEAKRLKSGTVTPGTAALPVHSHKKSKGMVGSHSVGDNTDQHLQYQSPQRKSTTENKRVSVRSPKNCYTETLSVSSGSYSDSISAGVLTIGDEDTSKSEDGKSEQEFGLAQAKKHGSRAEPQGGCKHGSPRRQSTTSKDDHSPSSSSNKGWADDDSFSDTALNKTAPTSPPPVHRGRTNASPKSALSNRQDVHNTNMLDGIWPGRSDTMAVQRYMKMHFSDDWITYLYFAQWGDAQLAADPQTIVRLETGC